MLEGFLNMKAGGFDNNCDKICPFLYDYIDVERIIEIII